MRQLFRTRSGTGLERQGAEPLSDLVLEVAGAIDLDRHPTELQLGSMAPALEFPEACGLFDERTPFCRLRSENLLDAALTDDRVHLPAKSDVREDLDEIGASDGRSVHEVLPFAASMQPPRDRELGIRKRTGSVRVVEDQLDLARVCAGSSGRPCVDHIVGLLSAELRWTEASSRPHDRVGDVRFSGSVRPHDHGDAGLEPDLYLVGERLEAAQLYRAQKHAVAA